MKNLGNSVDESTGDIALLEKACNNDGHGNVRTALGETEYTILTLATLNNRIKIVEYLIARTDLDINQTSKNGWTALHLAAYDGYTAIVNLILSRRDVNINLQNKNGWTALHRASINGHTEVVRLLLRRPEIKINLQNKDGITAFHRASLNGHVEIIKLLLSKTEININVQEEDGETALHRATSKGHFDVVKLLMARPEINTSLQDKDGWTVLHRASYNGNAELLKLLLARSEKHHINLVNANGWTALHCACNSGQMEAVKLLLARSETEINLQDKEGWTSLHWASSKGRLQIVKLLLLSRTDIDIHLQNIDGCTAFHQAASNGHVEIVKLLLSHSKIDLNLPDNSGWTALQKASNNGYLDVVKLLLSQLEIVKDGRTAAHDSPVPNFSHSLQYQIEPLKLRNHELESIRASENGIEHTVTNESALETEMNNNSNIISNGFPGKEEKASNEHGQFTEDVKLFNDLKFPPLLQISLISLKILIAEEELKEAKRSKAFGRILEINKAKKALKSWLEELLQAIVKVLPAELSTEDFMVVKDYTIKQLELHFEECIELDDEEILAGVDAFKAKIEAMNLSSVSTRGQVVPKEQYLDSVPPQIQSSYPKSERNVGDQVFICLPPSLTLCAGRQFHVFLTHNWANDELGRNNHQRVSKINTLLKQNGLITWFDEDRMKGQIRQTMSDALYQSMIVLCFITEVYEQKINVGRLADNCFFEFNLASNDAHLVEQRIAIAMEKSMLNPSHWQRGRLKSELGGQLIVDMTEDDDKPEIFSQQIQQLISRIHDLLETINNKR